MTDEEITYSTVRFHKSSDSQNQVRPDEPHGPREAGHKEYSVPWQLIVIALGILSSILLVTVAVLVTQIFQYFQEKHELQKSVNHLHHKYSTLQNNNTLMEEMLRNKTSECDALKDHPDSLSTEQNRGCGENKMFLSCNQNTDNCDEEQWFCYNKKCYFVIMDKKHWKACKKTCEDCSLSILNIDDAHEQAFLQCQLHLSQNYWIGFSYDGKGKKWTWVDNETTKLDLNKMNFNVKDGKCVFLSKSRLDNDRCENLYPCICEKKLDKFPDSLSKKCLRN